MTNSPGKATTLVIRGMTIDLPNRDEDFGKRVAKRLEGELSRLRFELLGREPVAGLGPLEFRLPADVSEHEVVRNVADAITQSLKGRAHVTRDAQFSGRQGADNARTYAATRRTVRSPQTVAEKAQASHVSSTKTQL
jgi:hypothetical protein